MTFTYQSTRTGAEKTLPLDCVAAIRQYLAERGYGPGCAMGELHDALLEFLYNGKRLLLHQLAPVFVYLAQRGHLWSEPEAYEGEGGGE